ncbi:MAG: hypothetical protein NTZ21_17005 [Actinobacteria bacterium]|nr:hypothetical protein [Actinomycetota bacterium]
MPRHRRFLSLWVMTGLVLGVGGALLGVGGPGVAQACSCVGFADDQAFDAADVVFVGTVVDVDHAGVGRASLDPERAAPDTTLPTDAPTSAKNSTAGSLVLVGVVVIIATGALVLTLKYRKR